MLLAYSKIEGEQLDDAVHHRSEISCQCYERICISRIEVLKARAFRCKSSISRSKCSPEELDAYAWTGEGKLSIPQCLLWPESPQPERGGLAFSVEAAVAADCSDFVFADSEDSFV